MTKDIILTNSPTQKKVDNTKLDALGFGIITLAYIGLVCWLYPSLALISLAFLPLLLYRTGIPCYTAIPLLLLPYIFMPQIEPMHKYVLIAFSTWSGWVVINGLDKRIHTRRDINPIYIVALAGLTVGSIVFVNAVRTHHNLMTASYDLGVFDNIFYNISKGSGMFNTMERNNVDQNHFYVHFSPIFYLLAPLYKIGESAEALIAIQALSILTSTLALYSLAKQLVNKSAAALISISWSIYTPLLGGLYYHFHEVVVGPTILFLIGASMLQKQKLLPWALTLLLAMVKEDYPILCIPAIILFGVWSNRLKLSLALATTLLVYFIAIHIFWIIPNATNWTGRIYGELGAENLQELMQLIIESPETILASMMTSLKLFNILELLVPLAFIALLSPWTYVLIAMPLLILYSPTDTVFSSNLFQYTFSTAPFLFLGTIDVFKKWNHYKQIQVGILILTIGLIVQWNFGMLGGKPFKIGFITITNPVELINRDAYKELQGIIKDIPNTGIVAADDTISPHISNRSKAYSLKYWDSNTLNNWNENEKPDYIITWKDNQRISFREYRDVYLGNHFKVKKKIEFND